VDPGDVVLLRSIYRGRVRWAWPHRFAGDERGRFALYCGPGNGGRLMKQASENDRYLEAWARGDPPVEWTWARTHVLRLMRDGDAHTVELFWDEGWSFLGWYVNLQAPLRVHGTFFDTTDWALDVVIAPDGTWRWKDEDDLAEVVELGILDEAGAAAVRAEGERVIAARPWPTGWEDWRPPPEWIALPLPEGWDVV
jgi:hypothetical protein